MGDSSKLYTSEDEEDLEALRIAALKTIKKKSSAALQPQQGPHGNSEKHNRFSRSLKGIQNKRGRFYGQGRNGKNGQFINRNRNSNLIAIPTVASEDEVQQKALDSTASTINLPQHRYCDSNVKEEKAEENTSKFNRYNKSDESESESEDDEAASEENSPGKLQKADSLEALMQELDDEIQGKTKPKESLSDKNEKVKPKKMKKKKRNASEQVSSSDCDAKPEESCSEVVESVIPSETEKPNSESDGTVEKTEVKLVEDKPKFKENYSPLRKRPRSRSPVNRRNFPNRRRPRNFHKFTNLPLQNIPYAPPLGPYPAPVMPFSNPPFNPLFVPPNVPVLNQPPLYFDRPLSPLAINAESLTTATLAPLSPRSAAFVLENKAIIERRKRSPRRSYSRSRSPSRSPRRSLTPRRSPRRSSRSPRRLSRSPKRRSLSPRRRSLSPRRRSTAKNSEHSPKIKGPVRERLGPKNKSEDVKESQASPKKEEKQLDPVLEARKKKFESNEIKMREGIIRLKPKDDATQTAVPAPDPTPTALPVTTQSCSSKSPEIEIEVAKPKVEPRKELDVIEELENLLREDALLETDDIELNPHVGDIFSDEDSTSDNEGRFKIKETGNVKPPVLSFTKLMNGERREIKQDLLPDCRGNQRKRERRDRNDKSRNRAPSSPANRKENVKVAEDVRKPVSKKTESQERSLVSKARISLKSERHPAPIERRKIEIKIKNPSKYERGNGKLKPGKEEEEKPREDADRKVELKGKEEVADEEEEAEPEIIVENTSGDEEDSAISEGDLRAQLSKKRAEKLHRIPVEGVSSRLLQNALRGAVFKSSKKKSKEQDITCSDGKLPIHLRLGIANNLDIFATTTTTTKSKRKSRKRKNREVQEQNPKYGPDRVTDKWVRDS